MKVVFIINEQAGSGKASRIWKKQREQLSIPFELHYTEYAGHAIEIARSYRTDPSPITLLVAVGGDGTIHEVIEGAAGCDGIIFGALKAGSGNDFARGYNIFNSMQELQRYVEQHPHGVSSLDLGRLEWQDKQVSFVNNTGFGFDAYIANAVNHSKLKGYLNAMKLGKLSYFLVTITGLFRFKHFNAKVQIDGQGYRFSDVWFIAICNQPYFGGGMKISPRSKSDDQKLELTVVHQLSRLKLLAVFLTVFWGGHQRFKEVTMLQGERFTLHLDASVPAHVDGESLGHLGLEQEVVCTVDDRKWKMATSEHESASRIDAVAKSEVVAVNIEAAAGSEANKADRDM